MTQQSTTYQTAIVCPHCQSMLQVGMPAAHNVEAYQKAAVVKTRCCGKVIVLGARVELTARVYEGDRTEDDWGE